MTDVFLNHIATATPPYDVHERFIQFIPPHNRVFHRMARLSHIDHRYGVLAPCYDTDRSEWLDDQGFYQKGRFPSTDARMRAYQQHALPLALKAVDALPVDPIQATHLITASCTGFYAPGLDWQLATHYQWNPERLHLGFMGCYAGISALKAAWHIVRSDPKARVLVVNLELCTLHCQDTNDLETLLSFLIFADGCAASWVSADPGGLRLNGFHSAVLVDSQDYITWRIGDNGFDMHLSGRVPQVIQQALPRQMPAMLGQPTWHKLTHWAVHPGGRSILDAVEKALNLPTLDRSRQVLRQFGNMSSATVLFVLQTMLNQPGLGCAMAFGPGITVEAMQFEGA